MNYKITAPNGKSVILGDEIDYTNEEIKNMALSLTKNFKMVIEIMYEEGHWEKIKYYEDCMDANKKIEEMINNAIPKWVR